MNIFIVWVIILTFLERERAPTETLCRRSLQVQAGLFKQQL